MLSAKSQTSCSLQHHHGTLRVCSIDQQSGPGGWWEAASTVSECRDRPGVEIMLHSSAELLVCAGDGITHCLQRAT